jgi:hypothetical protein
MIKENEVDYFGSILNHLKKNWSGKINECSWQKGPTNKLPKLFQVLEVEPSSSRKMWTYSTICMSNKDDNQPIEIHLFSAKKDQSIVELLTAIAFYHTDTKSLGLNHTVNFGRPWQDSSACEFGLISLPYLDGPNLENLFLPALQTTVKFYWLIPITLRELTFKRQFGIERLESEFQTKKINFLDPNRSSIV